MNYEQSLSNQRLAPEAVGLWYWMFTDIGKTRIGTAMDYINVDGQYSTFKAKY